MAQTSRVTRKREPLSGSIFFIRQLPPSEHRGRSRSLLGRAAPLRSAAAGRSLEASEAARRSLAMVVGFVLFMRTPNGPRRPESLMSGNAAAPFIRYPAAVGAPLRELWHSVDVKCGTIRIIRNPGPLWRWPFPGCARMWIARSCASAPR